MEGIDQFCASVRPSGTARQQQTREQGQQQNAGGGDQRF
jgi:hypothetical protein